MPETAAALFLLGLASGVHCAGMCGGILAALSLQGGPGSRWRRSLAHNAGRIAMYAVLGALAGTAGAASLLFDHIAPVHASLRALASVMLIAMGVHLLGFTRLLQPLERLGYRLWRHIQPIGARLLPADSLPRALALGVLWGMLPCALVYSALASALASGDARSGALHMLAFGLGTLPNLLAAQRLLAWLHRFRGGTGWRIAAGVTVVALGSLALVHHS